MAVKLSVGFQKKSGMPNYGSLGATCQVEFEIDPSLLQGDLEGFHEKARRAFSACQQAVNDQLARSGANGLAAPTNGPNHSPGTAPCNGHAVQGNGDGRKNASGTIRQATQSQARAIRAIADRQGLDLPQLLNERFNVDQPEELSIREASNLIDELKAPANDQGGPA